ncbi:hypothetical protein BpHYR1_048740 [Brachionus plicatilis]|uniref:Uncharacterized protein n=1 Tax=Brachionus plicatilis TaxID=10195 RepID=A0A3M7Q9Y8_BRAPC|nr:hypothetical protein BpHYR1_048740 [Brachionus plicatilis]
MIGLGWFINSEESAKGDIQKSEEQRTIAIQTTNESTPSREWSFKPKIFTLKQDIRTWWNRFKLVVENNKIVEADLQNTIVAKRIWDHCKTPDAALEPLDEFLETCVSGPVKVIGKGKCSVKLISFESEVEIIIVDELVSDFEGDNSGTVEKPANIGTVNAATYKVVDNWNRLPAEEVKASSKNLFMKMVDEINASR